MLSIPIGVLCVSLCSVLVKAKYNFEFSRAANEATQPPANVVHLPLDHFGTNKDTFPNRYWVNDEFYKDGGPVIFFDNGESDAEPSVPSLFLGQGQDIVAEYGQRFGGLLVLWEHRYYGKSLPSNIPTSGVPEDLANYYQYLTTEQAMEDVVVFAKNFSLASQPGKDLRPNSVPWIFVGGSYPGLRAAYLRLRNPEVVYASYSSSAPVQIQESFWQYFVAAERAMTETPGYLGCLHDLHAFANYVSSIGQNLDLGAAEAFLSAANLQWNTSTDISSDGWNKRIQALIDTSEVPFGDFQNKGLNGSLGLLCKSLIDVRYTNDSTATTSDFKDGIVNFYGLNRSVEIYENVIHDVEQVEKTIVNGTNASKRSTRPGLGERPDDISGVVSDWTAWAWQSCTETGYYQISNPSRPTNVVPGISTLDQWIQSQCVKQFGNTTAGGIDASKINNRYHGWHMSTTNVFHVNSQYDPWRALSVASDVNGTDPANNITKIVPAANTAPANGTFFGFVVSGGTHCSDFEYNVTPADNVTVVSGTHAADVIEVHELFASALSTWLPAYTKFAATPTSTINTVTATSTSTSTTTGLPRSGAPSISIWMGMWVLVAVTLSIVT